MPPHKHKTRTVGVGRFRRLGALLLLCLGVLGQYSGFTHFLSVAHGLCPEHGEVVHSQHQPAPPPLSPAAPQRVHRALSAAAALPTEHEHEHCLLFSQRQGQAVPHLQPRALPPAPVLAAPHPLLDEQRASPGIALWHLAPKHSPPA
jgi:hypothetical protein